MLSMAPFASAASCDRACLLEHAKQFNASILAHTPDQLGLGAKVQIRENTVAIALTQSRWMGVKQILSEGVYTDPVQGNVIEHVAAETTAGKPVYIGTRLKVQDGKITEVEIDFDDSDRVNLTNLVPYDPFFDTVVPVDKRATREQLTSIITRYFQGLTDHARDNARSRIRKRTSLRPWRFNKISGAIASSPRPTVRARP